MGNTKITTGQFVQIEQTAASIGDRIVARLVDYAIMLCWLLYWSYMLAHNDNFSSLAWLIIVVLPVMCYSLLWETLNNGQSPGKMLRHLRVVRLDGETPTVGNYMMRWLMEVIDMGFCCIGLLVILLSRNSQRLGDMAAGTIVVKLNSYEKYGFQLSDYAYTQRDYHPQYPEVEKLSPRQVEVIEKTLGADYSPDRTDRLAQKVGQLLGVRPQGSITKFLTDVLHDYQYYSAQLL